jgi:hypothetical protein
MHFRLSSVLLARLDKLAEAWGLSRSEVVRRLVADADADGVAPLDVPDTDELLAIASERARAGNMAAVNFLAARAREDPQAAAARVFADLLGRQS